MIFFLQEKLRKLTSETSLPDGIQIKEEKPDIQIYKPSIAIHPTVNELFRLYPHIKLPKICLTADLRPSVTLQLGEVENYYNRHNLNFQEHCRSSLSPPTTTARKRTMAPLKAKSVYTERPYYPVNGQIIPQDVEDTDKDVLRPIKIKIIMKIPPQESSTEKSEASQGESDEQETEKYTPFHKRRKLSESSSKENENPEETYHCTNSSEVSKSLSYVTREYVQYICNICDSIQHSSKDLREHQNEHLRCRFCRTTFLSLESKTHHLEGECLVKNAIGKFPSIELLRIENDLDIMKTYPNAFADFPSTMNLPRGECLKVPEDESVVNHSQSPTELEISLTTKDVVQVIEILSDNDDEAPTKNPQRDPPPAKTPMIASVIKPVVTINNDQTLDAIGSNSNEIITLQKLLSLNGSLKLSAEKSVQTDIPDQHGIKMNESEKTAMCPTLRQHLHMFRVPVVIKKGSFNVSYNYTEKPQPKRNLQLWNDITPVDIRKNNTKVTAALPDTNRSNNTLPISRQPNESSVPTSEIVSSQIIEERNCETVGNTASRCNGSNNTFCNNSYNKNYDNSVGTISPSNFSGSSPTTHRSISILRRSANSTFRSRRRRSPQLTCTNTTKTVDDSFANSIPISLPMSTELPVASVITGSTTPSFATSATITQRKNSESAVSCQVVPNPTLSNGPQSKSLIDSRTYSTSEAGRILPAIDLMAGTIRNKSVNSPSVNASTYALSPTYAIPPNTRLLTGATMPTLPSTSPGTHNPSFKAPHKIKYQTVILKSHGTLNTLSNQSTSRSPPSCHLSELNNVSLRPPTPSVICNNRNISTCTATMSNPKQRQIPTSSVWHSTNFQVPLNSSLSSTSRVPATLPVGYSNVPVMVVNSKSETSTLASVYSSVSTSCPLPASVNSTSATANLTVDSQQVPSNGANYYPIHPQIGDTSSIHYTPRQPVHHPGYHSPYSRTPSQDIGSGRNSFSNPNLRESAGFPKYFLNNNYCNTNSISTYSSNTYKTCSFPTSGHVSPVSCSSSCAAKPQLGHIRVKAIQELI